MGEFTNTSYRESTSAVVQNYKDRVNGATPYYKFTDKKPTEVLYWNVNRQHTTLDQGTRQAYDQLTDEDPFRYNLIKGFYLYGLGRIEPNIQLNEFGPESSPLEGEAYILPNTIKPIENDYFSIPYLLNGDKRILFRVLEVQRDTLDNNANWWRIHYQLDQTMSDRYSILMSHTISTLNYTVLGNTGEGVLLSNEELDYINTLSSLKDLLRDFYIDLFYKRNVQTFVYPYDRGSMLIYDPYLVEFLIRNKIFLTYDEKYLYISQATFRSSTFSIEYNKTIFRSIEERDKNVSLNTVWPIQICDPNSLLVDRMEEYLELSIQRQNFNPHEPINFYDMHLVDRIVNNKLYDETDQSYPHYRNIIINYMNGKDVSSITDTQLESIKNIEYARNKTLYYEIPLLMYILNNYISDLSTKANNPDESSIYNGDDIGAGCGNCCPKCQ